MLLITNAFRLRLAMFRWAPSFLLALNLALFATGCAKAPAVDEHTDKNANANAGRANQPPDQPTAAPLHLQPTIRGDIERISLAISMAHDAVKVNKWQDAVSLLKDAKKDVDTALGRKPGLSDELQALKSAIDRTIQALENRGKESEARLTELQTRIGAIKVNTF